TLAFGCLVGLAFFAAEAWRVSARHRRHALASSRRVAAYAAAQLCAGGLVAAVLVTHGALVADTVANTTVDLLHFSLHPFDTARLALQLGMIAAHSANVAATIVLAGMATRLKARFHHGSQAFRLTLLTLGLVLPALASYPTVFQLARNAKAQLVETRYAPQALNQRPAIQDLVRQSLGQIDAFPGLADLITVEARPEDAESLTDRAFQLWRTTGLAEYPVTSSVELYGADGRPVSRFAFNLPDDLTATLPSDEGTCTWGVFEEVSPFFAEERRVLHAGRAVCVPDGSGRPRPIGSVVVHAMLDYANLPFIASQNPYMELLRPADPLRDESLSGRDVEYAVYGWSRRPLYASRNRAWVIEDEVFERVVSARDPFWASLKRGNERFDVYLLNDRGGIYALGFPAVTSLGHLVNLAELTVLAAGTYLLLLVLNALFAAFGPRGAGAPALLREIRASFYRKLFLSFVAATVVPVIALAVAIGNYVANEINADVEQEAVRTVAAARRVVEDFVAPRAAQQGAGVDDNLMVWVSRLIDQDVNIFRGPRLQATSERNLFASGLLPTRTPADVYRALELRNEAATVATDRVGSLPYLVAATSISARQINALLTVPLTSRQQEIEEQIDALNRQVLLGALIFILAGAGVGYSMAERIADPVNRLTRATRRIARGDLDARIAATSSDELRRLVEAFNSMADELQRQRRELERTHRLEAWAEMARQVAHEIKNPLTPIQLNAEHLRRVHADRGEPLSPILEECVANILTQVKLLRQIASEFSNFASSPTARPGRVNFASLLEDIVEPYRTGLGGRIRVEVTVPPDLPDVFVDRSLIARSLTNIIENAIAAMPATGTLTLVASSGARTPTGTGGTVNLQVSDTGRGMDAEALARAFEPYFSTKATGTGLGLPIAKRNVELSGGSIAIRSAHDRGTTVVLALPVA
ncbi:MAG: HAMP domain-containing sensor histidine kinase, partial [Vicinamibacterales bacterium]